MTVMPYDMPGGQGWINIIGSKTIDPRLKRFLATSETIVRKGTASL